jgi:hypothetical protein
VSVLLTKGMIARGFSGRPNGYRIGCPPKRTVPLTAGISFGCNSARATLRLHGRTKLADDVLHAARSPMARDQSRPDGAHSRLLKTAGAIPLKPDIP